MVLNSRLGLGLVAAGLLFLIPSSASAQFNGGGGFPGGGGGFPGGGGGFGGGQMQITPQQLLPPILNTNWYMYNSVGGMGTTGGTVSILTTFGQQSMQQQQNNFGGGGFNNGFGGGGFGGFPGIFGINYRRNLARQRMAAAYRQRAMMQQIAMARYYQNLQMQAYLLRQQQQNQSNSGSPGSTSDPKEPETNIGPFMLTSARVPPQFYNSYGPINRVGGQFNPASFDAVEK